MELRHLRYFVTLAEELHFGRAAERLHIAQPPLSQQIRQLEKELGFELFHRTKRNVQLTEAGQVFLGEVLQIMRQLQQAIQVAQQTSRGEIGQLVVGFVSSAAYNILPTILRTFRSYVPGVSIELHELTTDQQLEWLREGRMDVGFLRPPVEDNKFSCETIFQEPLMVALPEAHLLANQSDVCWRSLANEPFILFPRILAPGLYDLIISLCQQAGFSPKVAQEAIQMQTIVSLVAAEMGVAIVPASLQNLQRIGVVYKKLQEPSPKVAIVADVGVAIAMIWRKNETSPTVERFLEIVRQALLNSESSSGVSVMFQALPKTIAFEEFLNWKPDGGCYELHDGVIVEMQPVGDHEEINGFLAGEITLEFKRLKLPYIIPKQALVKIPDKESGYSPDVIVINQKNLSAEPMWKKSSTVTQAASVPLVIEVVSTNWRDDYAHKLVDYETFGVPEYWIVDYLALGGRRYIGNPKQPTVSVYYLVDGEYQVNLFRGNDTIISPTFPELNLTAEQIFQAGRSENQL